MSKYVLSQEAFDKLPAEEQELLLMLYELKQKTENFILQVSGQAAEEKIRSKTAGRIKLLASEAHLLNRSIYFMKKYQNKGEKNE